MELDWGNIAPMIISVVFLVTGGGVLLLRPLMGRLGALLEAMAREKEMRASDEMHRLREEVETLRSRMELLEDRQDFSEGLLSAGSSRQAGRLEE